MWCSHVRVTSVFVNFKLSSRTVSTCSCVYVVLQNGDKLYLTIKLSFLKYFFNLRISATLHHDLIALWNTSLALQISIARGHSARGVWLAPQISSRPARVPPARCLHIYLGRAAPHRTTAAMNCWYRPTIRFICITNVSDMWLPSNSAL